MSATNPRWPGDQDRVAIVLPGLGYTPDMPLLYWTAKVLHQDGWTIRQLWWSEPPSDRANWAGWVAEHAGRAVDEAPDDAGVLMVGKSLGSLAVPLAAERSLPGIWLTPLLANSTELRAALSRIPPSLLVGGTADGSWDSAAARDSGHRVCEVEGADHGMEIPGSPSDSLRALDRVLAAVGAFTHPWTHERTSR